MYRVALIRVFTFVALGAIVGSPATAAEDIPVESRKEIGLKALGEILGRDPKPAMDRFRDFPVLADAIAGFAYGDVVSRQVLDPKVRQLATIASLAGQGMLTSQLKVHYAGALNVGVKPEDLIEVVYLTAVYAGIPKAINAANALSEVFQERGVKLESAQE